jgi:hypothetical protein
MIDKPHPIKISIVIPCYNYGHLIENAIKSATLCESPYIEVLVINDGSTDNSLEILTVLKEKYSFELISQSNGGLSAARNKGIDSATGDYLIFLDADDYLTKDAIPTCLSTLQSTSSELIIAEHYSISGDIISLSKTPPLADTNKENVYRYISKRLSIVNGGCLMHQSIFTKKRYNSQIRNSEDIPIFIYALANFNTSLLSAPIVNIIKHEDSMRHDLNSILNTGTSIVEEGFKEDEIPADIIPLKKLALAQRHSSIARAAFKGKKYTIAREHYLKAIVKMPRYIFKRGIMKRIFLTLIHP